jgi:hypothetical protein
MQTNIVQESPNATPEDGSSMLELKEAYNAGLLVTTVTADMINEQLLTAVYEDARPANDLVH